MTDQKPKAEKARRMIRCPASTYALVEELRALMAEQGDKAYFLNNAGNVVHGSVADAPLHVVVTYALTLAIEIRHPAREEMAAAHEARQEYLDSFKEGEETE